MKRSNGIKLLKFSIEKVLKSMENDFWKCVGTLFASNKSSMYTS